MKVYLKYIKRTMEVNLTDGRTIKEPCMPTACIEEVDESELQPGHAKLIGQWREPSFRNLCTALLGEDYAKGFVTLDLTCRCGDKIRSIQDMHDHWQHGHFDVPIYEEI